MSRKAGNFTRDCYNLQRYRDTIKNVRTGSLSEDSGTTTTTSEISSTDTEGGSDTRQVVIPPSGQIDDRIKKKQQETLAKNKLVAKELVKRAASKNGLTNLWAFYDGEKDNNGKIAVKSEADRDLYYMFIDTCVVNMISKRDWKKHHNSKNLSKYITVSEEAFAMLVLENIATTLLEKEGVLDEQGIAGGGVPVMMKGMSQTTKYTKGAKDQSGKMRGWRRKGIERYNELCENVIVRRGIVEIKDQLEIDLKKRYQREKREEEKVEDKLEVELQQGGKTEKKKSLRRALSVK